jgi:type IV fimbrial biogenesis protein FimT
MRCANSLHFFVTAYRHDQAIDRIPNTTVLDPFKIRILNNPAMRTSLSFHRHLAGFTLIELMVTLSLVAILAMLAVPSFNGAIASNRLSSATNEVYISLVQAKSEAVRRGQRITVCASANGTSCSNDGNGWNTGWITFVDGTRGNVVSVDSGEDVIAVGQAVSDAISIRGPSYFSFSADSRSRLMNGAFQADALLVCSTSPALDDSQRSKEIRTAVSGRLNVLPKPGVGITCTTP